MTDTHKRIPASTVTVAIPTYNRSALLKISLASVLAQDYPDFQVVVIDNASTDDTEQVVRSFADPRVRYLRNETNIGAFRNSNRAIEVNTSPYLTVFQDDDIMLPGFLRESVAALEQHPNIAFSFTATSGIDVEGQAVAVEAEKQSDLIPHGIIRGYDFLHQIVAGNKWIIECSATIMRAATLSATGCFDNRHCKDTGDFNLYYRLASRFDVFFIAKKLVQIRYHMGRESRVDYDLATGMLATMSERIDAIAHLIQSPRAEDFSYRRWLSERLLDLNLQRSQEMQMLVPRLNLTVGEQLQIAGEELERVIPRGESFILVDQNEWGSDVITDRFLIPFLERGGQYYGVPSDDETAIRELERLRQAGAKFIVFGWPAFWWLDYYGGLRDYLDSKYACVLRNSRLVAFDLRQEHSDGL